MAPYLRAVAFAATMISSAAAAVAQTESQPSKTADAPEPREHRPPADQARGWEQPPGIEGEDIALFLPRAILFVPNMALTVVFWPLVKGVEVVDRYAVVGHVFDFLYNDERTAGVFPLVSFQSDFGLSGGAKIFHKDLLDYDERISLSAKFGGIYQQSYQLSFAADHLLGSKFYVEARARYEEKPRLHFTGIGSREERQREGVLLLDPRKGSVDTRFAERRGLGVLSGGYAIGRPGEQLRAGASLVFNHRRFGKAQERISGDISIEQVYDTSGLAGFDGGAETLELLGVVQLDLRSSTGLTSRGMYLELFAGGALPGVDEHAFVHYGAEVTGFVDLFAGDRVLVLRVMLDAVEGAYDDIPFSNLPRLGGTNRLRGFRTDRFRDRKAIIGTLEYRYPIHDSVAGVLFVEAGKVAPGYGKLLDFRDSKSWQVGYGGGVIIGNIEDISLRLEIAGGEGVQFYLSFDVLRAFSGREDLL